MAVSNYTTLIGAKSVSGSIKEFVNNDIIPVETIVSNAELFIYQRMRTRQMIVYTTSALGTNADGLALPARFRGPIYFEFRADGTSAKSVPELKDLPFVLNAVTYDGTGGTSSGLPSFYAIDGTGLRFEKKSNLNRPTLFAHHAGLVALTSATGGAGTTTNFLTSDYPRLLMAACAMYAYEWMEQERDKLYWLKIAEAEIGQANSEGEQQSLVGADISLQFQEF